MQLPDTFIHTISTLFGGRGDAWLRDLPRMISDIERRWDLRALPAVPNLSYNYVAPAVLADGTPAMLKLGVPNGEFTNEVEALRVYAGHAICRLLRAEPERGAMLLERLSPGTTLTRLADDEHATSIAAQVMKRLWQPLPPTHSFPTVTGWAEGFGRLRATFAGRTGPFPAQVVEQAERLFADLLASASAPMLLHGDLHHDNMLRAEREPWLAIDPKGLAGEPAYEVGALLRNPADRIHTHANPRRAMARRVAILAEVLGFDPRRIAGWGYAQAVLSAWWSYEDHGEYDQATLFYAEVLEPLV
jgi:streptomycin 6-kinase